MSKNKEQQKKEREKQYIIKFKKLHTDFPEGKIVPIFGIKEPPDFKVGNIGIELTEIYRERKELQKNIQPKKAEIFKECLVSEIQIKFEQTIKVPLMVSIGFREGLQLKGKSKQEFVEYAAELIKDIVQKKNVSENYKETINLPKITGNGINYITIHYFKNLPTSIWQCDNSIWLTNPSLDQIKNRIQEKSKDILNYKEKDLEKKWLLLVETGEFSSMFRDHSDILSYQYKSCFDRIFILRDLFDVYYELKTVKPM